MRCNCRFPMRPLTWSFAKLRSCSSAFTDCDCRCRDLVVLPASECGSPVQPSKSCATAYAPRADRRSDFVTSPSTGGATLPSARAVQRREWKNLGFSTFDLSPSSVAKPSTIERAGPHADTPTPRSFEDALASCTKHSIIYYAKNVRVIHLGVSRPCPGAGSRPAAKFIAITWGTGPATSRRTLQCDRCCSISRWAAGIGGITSGRVDERPPLDGPLQGVECRVLPT
jgi:hypothetical protein